MRRDAGLTQEELAVRLHRTPPWVSKIERGTRGIELSGVARWARACGVQVHLTVTDGDGVEHAEFLAAEGPVGLAEELAALLPHLDDAERALVETPVRYLRARVAARSTG